MLTDSMVDEVGGDVFVLILNGESCSVVSYGTRKQIDGVVRMPRASKTKQDVRVTTSYD